MNNRKQQKERLLEKILGSQDNFILEHQCFNGMCFFAAGISYVSVILNILIGLSPGIIWGALVFGILASIFYYFGRVKGYFYTIYWFVLVWACLFVSLAWIYTGGISGTASTISLIILAMINLITSKWRRIVSIVFLCFTLGLLYWVEFTQPELIVSYKDNRARFIDNYLTFLIAVLIISFVIHFTMQHFRSERKKVKDREEKLQAILDNIPDSVWLKDHHLNFTMVNKPFADVCHVPIPDIIGKTVFDIWPPEKADRFHEDDQQVLTTGNRIIKEESINDSQHGEKRFEVIKKPIMDLAGKITGIVGIARDITARYGYEDRLKKYERIVGTSIDQMALVNRDYEYEAANASYLKACSCLEKDLVGHTIAEIKGTELFEKKIKPMMDKAFSGEIVNFTDEIAYDGIGNRHIDVSYFPHKNDKGITTNVVTHIKDITDKKQMEQRLIRSEKMEAIGTLAGGIAHDFNNILSGILGYAQLGQVNINDPEKLTRHLDQIIKGSQRAGDLVRQILTFSRRYEYKKQPLEIAVVVNEAIKLIRAAIPAFIEIQMEITSTSRILADPSQIHQVIMNLCTNAYHAMIEAKGTLTVVLKDEILTDPACIPRKDRSPGIYVLLEVNDTGHGMDDQTLEKIFDPYFTTKEMGKGTGLGLALVHGIVEEHLGWIRVDSKKGKGTSFKIFFPALEKETQAVDRPEVSMAILSKGTERIMVVDDETSILFSTRELLEDCGYKVSAYSDGKQAFDEFKKTPDGFDLIITDMTMPKMTGDELAREILKIRPDLPIILCTGYSDQLSEERAIDIGIRQFVQKPLISHNLTVLIRTVLDGR